jgi:hypothetical protein
MKKRSARPLAVSRSGSWTTPGHLQVEFKEFVDMPSQNFTRVLRRRHSVIGICCAILLVGSCLFTEFHKSTPRLFEFGRSGRVAGLAVSVNRDREKRKLSYQVCVYPGGPIGHGLPEDAEPEKNLFPELASRVDKVGFPDSSSGQMVVEQVAQRKTDGAGAKGKKDGSKPTHFCDRHHLICTGLSAFFLGFILGLFTSGH